MTEPVYILRHGQTDWNAEYRLQGQTETDLNMTGRQQAARNGRALARLIPDPQRYGFIASPMRRTRETMEIARSEMGLPPDGYRTEPRIVEVHFGDWERSTFAELDAAKPGTSALRAPDKWNFVPPGKGAESYAMLAERVRPWVSEIGGPAVVVTHGGVIRVLFHLLNGMAGNEAALMDIPQDRIARLADGRIEWVDQG